MNARVLAGTVTSLIGIAMVAVIAVAPSRPGAKPASIATSRPPAASAWTEAEYKVRVPSPAAPAAPPPAAVARAQAPPPRPASSGDVSPSEPAPIMANRRRIVLPRRPVPIIARTQAPPPPPPPPPPAEEEAPTKGMVVPAAPPRQLLLAEAPSPAPTPPQLYSGRLLFQPEQAMQLRQSTVVLVRMDAGASPDLKAGIDPKQYTVDTVEIGLRMRVHLAANPPDAFDILPMSPPDEQQAVSNIAAATWMWSVTPKKDGPASLLLNVWALSKVEGSDTLLPVAEKTETIHVSGLALPEIDTAGLLEKVLDKLADKTGEALWSAAGLALSALGGWIAKWWRKPGAAAAAVG